MSEIVGRRSSNWDLLPEGENGDEGRDTGWISWREYVKKGGGTRREEMSPSSGMWEREGDYTASMSPGLDSWRELSCSRSARNKWGSRSHRSRSRSPIRGSRSESERWPERNKNGVRGSNLPCKDFASGRCRRGSQCRFLHEIYDGSRRHYDSALSESRGGDRLENRFSSGSSYPTNQAFEDVHDLHKDGNKSSIPCADSERGRCHRGSACKYVHRSSDDNYGGVGDSSYDKREGFVYFGRGQRSERERRTISHVLCKFFESGRCRNGDNCKFSHGGSGRIEPEERPTDPWQVHNTGSENRLRDDPLMGDKAGDKHAHNSPNWKSYTNNAREGEQGWLPRPGKASVKTISNSPQWQRENDIGISTELNKDGETCKWDKNMGKENRLKEDRCWLPPPDKNMGKENKLKDDLGWSLSPDNASVKKISNSPQWQRKNDTSRISTEMNKDGETREWVHNMGTENRLIDDRMPGDKAGDRHASGSLCWRSLANDNREEEQSQSLWSVKKASHSPQGESPGGGSPTTTNRKKEQGWSMWSVKKASHSPQGKSAGWERPTITNKEKEQGWSTRSVEKASLSPQGHSAGWERSTNTNSEKEQGSSPWSVKKASHSPQEQSHGWGSPTNTNKEKEQGWSLGPDNASVIKISNSPQWQKENNTGIPTSLNNDGETRKWVHNLGEESRLKDDAMMDDKAGDKHVDSSPKYRNTNNTTEERGWPPLPDTVSLKKASNSSQWQRENYTSGTSTEVNKDGEIHYTLRGDSTQNSFVHVQTNYPDGLMRQPLQGQVPELHGSRDAIQRPETELNKQTQLSTPGYSAVASFQLQKPIQLQLFPQKIDQISALNALSSSVQQPGRKVDERNFICSPLNLRATAAPSSVISDQVPQLTESASLAQVLANRTNLSQLYASLSSLHSNPNSSNLLRPLDLKPEHHEKQYDPLSDNLDPVDVDADSHLPESSCIPEGKHLAIEETQQFSIGLEQSTVTSWPNDIDLLNVCSSEEEEEEAGQCKNEEEKQLEQSKRSAETETKKEVKEKAADATEDKEGVEEEKEEDKRSKSVKGARMFKFALVGFVKEILKPTWKEGQMSREVHKTIVKKVVDKVTSSTRSASIQHTQENIDSYLSHSKPKVTKLIQAYVEKYNKT